MSATDHRASPVCPWWLIHTFDNPVRRLLQNPEGILRPFVRPGDTCLDLGCGIGYFTIPMANLAGPTGQVIAADLQPQMLAGVRRRAEKAGVESRVRLLQVTPTGLEGAGRVDFALMFWMLHEVPDQAAMLRQVRAALKPGGRLLLVEPKGHVSGDAFAASVTRVLESGFAGGEEPRVRMSRAQVFAAVEGNARGR